MAIPGAIVFTLAGATGQLISNKVDGLRIRYVFENEDSWKDKTSKPNSKSPENIEDEFERRFGFLERIGLLKKPGVEERVKVLRREIEKIDGMLKKVDDEIITLENSKNENSDN